LGTHIRMFNGTDEEYAALVALNQVLEPDESVTVSVMRQMDMSHRDHHGLFVRYVAEVKGQIVGSGAYYPSEDHKEILVFSLQIHPRFQTSDVPARMQDHLIAQILRHHPPKIASDTKEDQIYRIRLLETAGFDLKMRFPRSLWDVTTVDPSPYVVLEENLRTQNIELVTLTDVIKQDPDWQHNIWRMFNQILVDIPSPHPVTETPFEEYAEYYSGELFRPDSWAIALDRNERGVAQYVGMCVVNIMRSRTNTLFAGITGTVRSHRRRKIATALKLKTALYAREHGYRYIYTNNEENNPMYDLNLRLGFQPLPAWLYYEKSTEV
jgi:mycothiol synthase